MFNVHSRTILYVKAGSNAYGTNTAGSDIDYRGVCIEPKKYHYGCFSRFDQFIENNPDDITIYSFRKFVKLASECNPNIIEILYTDSRDILSCNEFGEKLINFRKNFLSKNAKVRFLGYASSQLKRIKNHRSWLLNPITVEPRRSNNKQPVTKSELNAYNSLSDDVRTNLAKEAITLYVEENKFQGELSKWKQYQSWLKNRNEKRFELEAQFGYDTKHAMHLIRLMRMCKEILETGSVIVKRPDFEQLLEIRAGRWTYDELIEQAQTLEDECNILVKSSPLPNKVDNEKIENFVVDLTEQYLQMYG